MIHWWWIIIALFVGAIIGFLGGIFCIVAGRGDEEMERMKREKEVAGGQ